MKRFFIFLLLISIGFNIYFLLRKIERVQRANEVRTLHYYKDISYKEGYEYFETQFQNKYPESIINNKHYIVYLWDSTIYDIINKDQMKVLDSMAASYEKYNLEYVFATEMEEAVSLSFLKRNQAEFKNVKMLYNMDDYISSLYSNKDVKLKKQKVFSIGTTDKETQEKIDKHFEKMKRKSIYLILDNKGKVIYNNDHMQMILKDSLFFNSLKTILPTNKAIEILN